MYMDYIGILFILIGLGIIVIVVMYYPFFEKLMMDFVDSKMNGENNVEEIKDIMISLDKPSSTQFDDSNDDSIISEMINIPYDFLYRTFVYYGKPILHNLTLYQ